MKNIWYALDDPLCATKVSSNLQKIEMLNSPQKILPLVPGIEDLPKREYLVT